MSNREIILSKIANTISNIENSEIEISNNFISKLTQIRDEINGFAIYLPLIGDFNAGKSSLINSYLGRDELLPTNIIPQTAVATEIYYDKQERIEVYKFESTLPLQTIDGLDFSEVDNDLADYLKVYINSDNLRKYDLILVDMPGLDSNIKRHNQSILGYITKSANFIFLLNIEDGAIKNSSFQFLKEIRDYRLDFFTLLNKIDKKLPDEIDEIKKHISAQLSTIIEKPYIGVVSAIDNQIDDFINILESIDVDEYIQKLFFSRTQEVINSIIFDLTTRRDAITLDTREIDKKISELLSKKSEINKEFESEKRKVERKFSQTLLSEILRDVENSLRLNIDSLIQSLEVSNANFNAKVNEIIRPVIVAKIKNYSETVFTEVVKNIEIASSDMISEVMDIVVTVDKGASVVKSILTLIPALDIVLKKANPLLTVISTVTSIILEVFGVSKREKAALEEQERRSRIREHLENVVIPSIPSQIAPSIQKALDEIRDNFFDEIKQKFDEMVKDIENSLNTAKKEKEEKKYEIESQKNRYELLINQLKGLWRG